jgi:hypothetical protein
MEFSLVFMYLARSIFRDGVSRTNAGRAWTPVSTRRSWFSSQDYEMCTDFPNNPQSRSGDVLFLKVHEQRLVLLVRPFSEAISQ